MHIATLPFIFIFAKINSSINSLFMYIKYTNKKNPVYWTFIDLLPIIIEILLSLNAKFITDDTDKTSHAAWNRF